MQFWTVGFKAKLEEKLPNIDAKVFDNIEDCIVYLKKHELKNLIFLISSGSLG